MTVGIGRRSGGVVALVAALSMAVGGGGPAKQAVPGAREVSASWARPRCFRGCWA
ncbi:MAG: hypothetical protein U0797_17855 [Gemmataceae bacterium]